MNEPGTAAMQSLSQQPGLRTSPPILQAAAVISFSNYNSLPSPPPAQTNFNIASC